jgi:hypothetical protein
MARSEKPLTLKAAVKNLQAQLPKTMHVGSGFGLAEGENKKGHWCIYVYTDDKDLSIVPKEFEGFPIHTRNIPQAYGI